MRHLVAMLLLIAAAVPGTATAEEGKRIGDLEVEQAWARATAPSMHTGAAYVIVVNHGKDIDRLVGASTPVARMAQLHTHMMEGSIMKMRSIKGVEVHPGEPTVMRPGGLHIMLMGLNRQLIQGDTFPLTLTFEHAGSVEVTVAVQSIGSRGPMTGGPGHGAPHGGMHHPMN